MLYVRLDEQSVHRSVFHSLRMQLFFVGVFSVALPATIIAPFAGPSILEQTTVQISLFFSFIAAVLTLLSLRRIGSYFGSIISQWILPVYSGFFMVLLSVVLALRAPYSSILLLVCFASTFLSFYVLAALMVRGRRSTCYIVPAGRARDFQMGWNLQTKVLAEPHLPDDPKAIFVADLHADIGDEWEHMLTEAALNGLPVYHYTQLREAMTGKVQFDHLSENSFGSMIPAVPYAKIKRAIDLLATAIILPILLPLLMIVALLIKIDSDGPALFRQKRMGFRGRYFYIMKFRTMTCLENGDDHTASITQENDQRITRIGAFLRRTRIDELPQMWNIIKGEMSWIGPRPEALSLSFAYETEISNYRYRHMVRPGITGWAQVHQGHVTSIDDVDEKLQYDFYYVKNISFWLDIVIALRTIRVMLSGFGAK